MDIIFKEDMHSDVSVLEVCIFEDQDQFDFKYTTHDFDIYDENDNLLNAAFKKNHLFRIKIKEASPSLFEYYILLHESENLDYIKKKTEGYKKSIKNVFYREVGGDVVKDNENITNNKKYLCLNGPYRSEEEARKELVKNGELNHCRIHKKKIKDGKMVLELFDPDGEDVIDFSSVIKIVPKSISASFELRHLRINNKLRNNRQIYENLYYQGGLIVRIDSGGKLAGINVVNIDDYIKGVLVSEISCNVSADFAKAMAIVCRSNVFARYGHKHFEESYDFCNAGHCMRYFGKEFANDTIISAVEETKNQVLVYEDKICEAYYSYSCGGHTDVVDGVWLRDKLDYLEGHIDNEDKFIERIDLTKEEDAAKWALKRPDVYCNLTSLQPPASMKDGASSFRWEVFYSRQELTAIIKEKTGEDVGTIYEIIPIERSVSGRIKKLQILGSLKNIYIKGELNIRTALSPSQLKSSCFIVESEMDGDGVPYNFTLIGCGVGHGIGLCKVGAAVMAENGKKYDTILKHYYNKCQIKRI
jgi:SpoIID/LytB domain protein